MPKPVEPPVFENLLAAGLAGGAAVLLPFAVAGIRASGVPDWPWGATLVTGWTWLGLFGVLAFRVRPMAKSRKWFSVWFSAVLLQLVALALFLHGFAMGWLQGGAIPSLSLRVAPVLVLLGLFGAIPAIFLTAVADRGGDLLVLQATAPMLLPVVFVALAMLEGLF